MLVFTNVHCYKILSTWFIIVIYLMRVILSSLIYTWDVNGLPNAIMFQNKRMDVDAIHTYRNESATAVLTHCLLKCSQTDGCHSINFLIGEVCELMDVESPEGETNGQLVDVKGYVHASANSMTLNMVSLYLVFRN